MLDLKNVLQTPTNSTSGLTSILDSYIPPPLLSHINQTRLCLQLDNKRPTVTRRFHCDDNNTIKAPIEALLSSALDCNVHCNKYMRFLEYTDVGSHLLAHSDGNKVCEDTGKKSTHTCLIFLTDVENGGETVILRKLAGKQGGGNGVVVAKAKSIKKIEFEGRRTLDCGDKDSDGDNVICGIQPLVGRIFLFPHITPHAGAITKSVPKIMLRLELCLST
ncbi:hypothetical protein ScalyP_jg264 [Parmales sp. scaly parma]|nr:hypothetical protein ScalyP_jg264 [Parmales sp. scaly parma]